jgi:MSHA pilin protein MshA
MKRRNQKGFTLIELIITIVIIGVLAAVAIPRFQNLSGDAEKGVAAGVGSALASASSVNYARSVVPGATACGAGVATPAGCTYWTLASCANIETNKALLADIPAGYTISGAATFATGTTAQCTVTSAGGATATFNAYGT